MSSRTAHRIASSHFCLCNQFKLSLLQNVVQILDEAMRWSKAGVQDGGRRPTISLGMLPGGPGTIGVRAKSAAASSWTICSGERGSPP